MKKFILDFRLFRYKVIRTALLPNTIVVKSIHNTVNCSVCKMKEMISLKLILFVCASTQMLNDNMRIHAFVHEFLRWEKLSYAFSSGFVTTDCVEYCVRKKVFGWNPVLFHNIKF